MPAAIAYDAPFVSPKFAYVVASIPWDAPVIPIGVPRVAEMLGRSEDVIYDMCAADLIPHQRIGTGRNARIAFDEVVIKVWFRMGGIRQAAPGPNSVVDLPTERMVEPMPDRPESTPSPRGSSPSARPGRRKMAWDA